MEMTSNSVISPFYRQESHRDSFSEALEQRIFAQLRAVSSDISRLSTADAGIFRSAFQQETLCYANSWLYLLRSTRNDQGGLGYKLVGNQTLMGIGYRNGTLYIVHPVGTGRFETTLDFCRQISNHVTCPIILKKIDQELYEYLHSTGMFEDYANGLTHFEEEAYPENLLILDKLYAPGPDKNLQPLSLLRKVKRFENGPMNLLAMTEGSSFESYPGFQALFGPNPDKYKSYLEIIQEVSSQRASTHRYKICMYLDEYATIHGLYISELLQEECMGLYCAVSSRSFPGITEWMDYDFFRQLFHDGIHYLYLGGSETSGVDAYIQKLLPVTPPYTMRPMKLLYRGEKSFSLNSANMVKIDEQA